MDSAISRRTAIMPVVCIAIDDDGEAHALRDPAGNGQTLVIVATPTSASPVYVPTTPLVPTKATSALQGATRPDPQGGAIVFGAEQPAALQHRHNLPQSPQCHPAATAASG